MKAFTSQNIASEMAERWRRIYEGHFEKSTWKLTDGRTPKEVYDQLVALGPDPSVADVSTVLGNDHWATTRCHECEVEVTRAVQLGEVPEYESSTAMICLACLKKAVKLLEEL